MSNRNDETMNELNKWFSVMVAHATASRRLMQEDLEFYYADVDNTRTQLTQEQLDFIREQYDIPISTKISWAIIEQMTAFLTGGKPNPRLIATTQGTQDFATMYASAVTAVWYECHMNRELALTIKETLAGGLSWIQVRPNDFYNESTFGVVSEYVPWYKVFVDPHAEKPDYSDAEYICKADVMPKSKAEKKYDITLADDELGTMTGTDLWSLDGNQVSHQMGWPWASPDGDEKNRYVWIREFFSKQQVNVYISEEGAVASKRPKPIEIPNPEKEALAAQIMQMRMEMEQALAQAEQTAGEAAAAEELIAQPETRVDEAISVGGATQRRWDEVSAQMNQMAAQISEAEQVYTQMPDTVTAYEFTTIAEKTEVTRSYFRKSEKFVKRWLCVGDKIVEQGLIPCDEYPLIPFSICQANRPDKVYGVMHFIKDIVKALNKFWSLLIYDMQTSAHRKVFYFEGTVLNPAKAERDFAHPMAWIGIKANPDLPNGGQPLITEPSNLNPAIERIIGLLQNMIEYITGISALMQGQPSSATPDTFGGIQTMQTFGTERIKLYSRWLEDAMERMTYVMVCYLQAYAPKNEVISYLDDNGDQHELQILQNQEALRFKVRMNMTAALPTARHMAAQILGVLSGQTADPHMQSLLTQYMVDYMDVPESAKMREEINVIKNLSSQLEQMQEQMKSVETENKQLRQQNFQKDLEKDYSKAAAEVKTAQDTAIAGIEQQAQQGQPGPQGAAPPQNDVPLF